MDVDESSDNRSRRRGDDDMDVDTPERQERRSRPKDRRHEHHRDREELRSRDKRGRERDHDRDRERRRSRTPDSSSRRPRSRERHRQRHRDRDRDAEPDRDQGRDRDRERRKRHRSPDDRDSPKRSSRRDRDRREDDAEDGGSRGHSRKEKPASPIKRSGPLPTQEDSWAVTKGEEPEKPKEKPNYGTTGVLAAASNSVAQADGTSVTLKYHEPAEARKPPPKDQWKLFVFKGDEIVETIDLGLRTCWLIGKHLAVVDLPAEHPSISKQHAVIQFRYTEKTNEFGDKKGRVKPYLIDLESANGTKLNGDKVPDSRYLELRNKDMVQFGHSTREYVIMLAPRE